MVHYFWPYNSYLHVIEKREYFHHTELMIYHHYSKFGSPKGIHWAWKAQEKIRDSKLG